MENFIFIRLFKVISLKDRMKARINKLGGGGIRPRWKKNITRVLKKIRKDRFKLSACTYGLVVSSCDTNATLCYIN